jgi:hypothetical protein
MGLFLFQNKVVQKVVNQEVVKMKLKLDEKGNAVLKDGHPVYVHPDGTEAAFDAKEAHVKIGTLTQENAARRTELKTANERLSAFSGIDDPAAALKAMQFAASMEGKKVMDDDGIQKIVAAALKPIQNENEKLKAEKIQIESAFYETTVGEKIATSEFLKKTFYSPSDAKVLYGKNFKVEDGKIVPYDDNGTPIYSKINAGSPASVDEALQHLVDLRPDKDNLYRPTGLGGGGTPHNSGTGNSAGKFDHLPPAARIAAARAAGMKE